jgi:uncharacterized protein (DUF58 family)
MNIREVRKAVGKIQATLFKNSNSYSIGMLKSHFKGTGLQFKEHQIYSHGDDVRFIDWKILAKTNTPYIKTFDEERNVEIAVVIDASSTMLNGYKGTSKLQAAIEICCLLYLLARETNDYVHAIILSDEVINLPKKSGEEGIARLVAALEEKNILDSTGKINITYRPKSGLSDKERQVNIMKHLSKNREIVLLSDFNEFLDMSSLRKMLFRRNVHGFQILSPLDEAEELPYTFFTSGSHNGAKGKLAKIDLGGKRDVDSMLGKKMKQLRVQERYLESFIREML